MSAPSTWLRTGLSQRERALKIASDDLLHDAVGKYEAADVVGLGKSQAQRCCSVNDETSFLNLRHVAELERRASVPFVSAALCKLAGGVFLRLPEDFGDGTALPLHVMELAHEVGDVSARVCEALAVSSEGGGAVRPHEAARVEAELDELIAKAVQTRALVRALQGVAVAPSYAGRDASASLGFAAGAATRGCACGSSDGEPDSAVTPVREHRR